MAEQQVILDPITGEPILMEYSVSKGWQPVDLGTMSGNLNYSQDLLSTGMDPAAGVLSGLYDPSAYADVPVEVEEPELTLLPLYEQSGDELSQMVFGRIQEGARPDQVVTELTELGYIEPDSDTAKGILSDATTLREEFSKVQRYQQAVANPQMQTNPNAARFLAAGLPNPAEQFTDEDINPLLPLALQAGQEGMGKVRDYENFANSDRFRDVLGKMAGATEGHANPEFDEARREERQGAGGTRLERFGRGVGELGFGLANELGEAGPEGVLRGYAENVARFNPAYQGANVGAKAAKGIWGWLNDDPDAPDAPSAPESGNPKALDDLIAQVAQKNKDRGGAPTGVGGRIWGALNQVSEKHGAPRGSQKTRKDYQAKQQQSAELGDAAYAGWMAQLAAHRAQQDTNRARQTAGTPTSAILMGRMGL